MEMFLELQVVIRPELPLRLEVRCFPRNALMMSQVLMTHICLVMTLSSQSLDNLRLTEK